ncbi:Uncharacterised protein [Bordetella pertussis]|nr:Uncharacterised protein [Bordetella pertussis]
MDMAMRCSASWSACSSGCAAQKSHRARTSLNSDSWPRPILL